MGLFDSFFHWETFLFGPSTTALIKKDPVAVSPATKFATTGDSSSGEAPAQAPAAQSADGLDEWVQQQMQEYEKQLRKGKENTLSGGMDDRAKEALRNYGDELRLKVEDQRTKRKKEYDEAQVALRAASRRRARQYASGAGGGSRSLMGGGGYTPSLMGR